MKFLLDTHVFLWAITDDERLSAAHRRIYLKPESELWLSVASIWETLIRSGLGKLKLPSPVTGYLLKQMERNRVGLLPVRATHLAALEDQPLLHRDPFDRMLLAQAAAEEMTVLSSDDVLRRYSGRYSGRVL